MPADDPATATTLVDLLRRQADRYGDKVAFRFVPDGETEHSALSFAELDLAARSIAAGLQEHGATGRRVLVVCRPGLDSVAAYFGCLYAGAVAVPVQDRLGRLTQIVPDVRASFVLADDEMQTKLRPTVDGLVKRPLTWLAPDASVGDPDAWVPPEIGGESTAMLQYTSGSTRAPKGVVLSHANLLANLAAIQQAWGGDDTDVAVYWLPQHHDMGLIGGILAMVYVGCSTVLMSPASFITRPLRWLAAISRYRATMTTAPNFAYNLCVERSTEEERAALDLSCWTTAMNGAEPVHAATLRAFADAFAPAGFRYGAFMPVYGLAEATLLVTGGSDAPEPTIRHIDRTALGDDRVADADPGDDGAVELVGCGLVRGGQQIVIVDPETRLRRGPDEVGEIWISGPCVAHGYRGKPEDTEATFGGHLADDGTGPFLRTGDLGFLRDGELFVTGRCKDLIIIRGTNYYPNDIEKTVQTSSRALLAGRGAVFSVEPVAGAGERLVVVQELNRQLAASIPDLNALLVAAQTAIVRHHGVRAYALLLVEQGAIPTTSSGKIQRRAARQRYLDGEFTAVVQWQAPPGSDDAAAGDPAQAARVAAAMQQAVAMRYWQSRQG